MTSVLRYGLGSEIRFDLPAQVKVVDCDAPRGQSLSDPAGAVVEALDHPLDFPPLTRARVPGDRVVIALDHEVPQAATIVAAVVGVLLNDGADPADITILRTRGEGDAEGEDPRIRLADDIQQRVVLETHNPADKTNLSYLAASSEGQPIYLNRKLADADLIVPIGCMRLESSLAYHGVHDALFPAFSDTLTVERYRAADAESSSEGTRRRREETDEVAWLLGVLFTIQVIPGAGEAILHVLAGEPRAVFKKGKQLCEAAWSYSVPGRASLVVAAIEGTREHQTWENIARALAAASRAVADNGAIALVTDLETQPGPSLRRVAAAENPESALRKARKEGRPDLLPATQLAHALQRTKVYLLSRLDEEVVEELGLAHVSRAEEITRLTGRHPSCILLANAQYAAANPVDE